MKQSTYIFGAILIAFLIYITVKGQLPQYISLFTGKAVNTSKVNTEKPATTDKPNPYTETLDKVIKEVFSQAGLV